nr:hypothetical protein [Tanacetum cinerariifolium]
MMLHITITTRIMVQTSGSGISCLLAVATTFTGSGNSNLAVGMPCAFYSQQSSHKLDAPSAFNSKDPQNTDDDVTFEVKEPEFEVKEPESVVHVSSSSSAKTKKHDDKTIREAKGKSPIKFTNTFSAAGPLNTVVHPTLGKSSYVDTSQYPDDPNMLALEDITYSDDEEDVGVDADFSNLETTITANGKSASTPIDTKKPLLKDPNDASEGFEQILDFLNANVIQYALMVNPTIYVSCIKQFSSSILIKKVNDDVRLQALIDSLVRNVDSSSKFYMYPRFLQLMIAAQVGNLSSHTTKYTSPALTQKQAADDVDYVVAENVPADDVVADVVAHASSEPTPASPTPTTTPLPPSQELPSTSHVARGIIALIDADEDATLEEVAAEVDATKDAKVAERKVKKELEENASMALKRKSKSSEKKAAKKQKLDEEVEELKKHLQIVPNDEDDVYTEATPLALKTMFEKPNVEAQVWKNQRGIHGLAKVKS